jgi:DivIVA domain-containing protein
MDVSPKTVREVEFREKLRGYHPEDVDQFLERVAKGIEILQERVRAATERAVRAERAAAESAGSDDTLRRTLVLAQRTADAAVQEAQEQAAQILAESEARAAGIVGEAQSRVASMIEQAESGLRTEVAELAAARDVLIEDVGAINRWLDEHRSSLTATLVAAAERLQGDLQVLHPAPSVPSLDLVPSAQAARSDASSVPAADAGITAAAPDHPDPSDPSGDTAGPDPAPTADASEAVSEWEPGVGSMVQGETAEDWDAHSRRSGDNEAVASAQFFAELRDAVEDPKPLGPREADGPNGNSLSRGEYSFFDDDDDDLAGARRFGSRLRRRR